MNKFYLKLFLFGVVIFILISILILLITNDPCRKFALSQPHSVDSEMFSTIAIVNSRNFAEVDLRVLFKKIETDFPIMILTTQPFKNAEQAFDLTEIFNESLVICNNYALGFYPKRFGDWLELIDANTSNLPDYSYLNYIDDSDELIILDKFNYVDFDFHQKIVIIGDVGGETLGRDFYLFINDQNAVLHKPQLLASMIYTINKREFLTYAPLWVVSVYSIITCLIITIFSFLLMRNNKIMAYLIYKLIQVLLLCIIYFAVIYMITNGSNLIVDLGHLFALLIVGGEFVFWTAFFLNKSKAS